MSLNAGTVTAARGAATTITVSGGTVTASATGWFVGSGLALALANAHFVASVEALGATIVTTMLSKKSYGSSFTLMSDTAFSIAQGVAVQANAYASAIVTHVTTNAVVPATGLLDHGGGACSGNASIT